MAVTRRQAVLMLTPALALALGGCGATTQAIRPRPNAPDRFLPWTDAPPTFRVGAGDRIKVSYVLTPELDEEATVGPDGYLDLKSTGPVPAQNQTLAELQRTIRRAAMANLRNPVLTLSVTDPKSARIIVGGQVQKPGVYALPPRCTVMEAVMLAGGFLPESRMSQVVLIRHASAGGGAMLRTVDLQRYVSTGESAGHIALAQEDIVFVPRSRPSEADLWVDENINKLLPFNRDVGFSYALGNGIIR